MPLPRSLQMKMAQYDEPAQTRAQNEKPKSSFLQLAPTTEVRVFQNNFDFLNI